MDPQLVETVPKQAVRMALIDCATETLAQFQELVCVQFYCAAVPLAAIGRVLVPTEKWSEGYELQTQAGKPFVIVLVCEDGFFYVRASKVQGSVVPRPGGSDFDEDAQTCIAIPANQFRQLDLATSLFAQ